MPPGRKRNGDADVKVNIRMSQELFEDLTEITSIINKKTNMSFSEVLRKALEAFVEKNKKLLTEEIEDL